MSRREFETILEAQKNCLALFRKEVFVNVVDRSLGEKMLVFQSHRFWSK